MDSRPTLDDEVEALLNAPQLLTEEQLTNLACILSDYLPRGVEYGADFDVLSEISDLLTTVKAMRRSVLTDGGVPKVGVSARDLKEVATASNTLLQTLLKVHGQVMSFDRMRAIENAVAKTMRDQPDAVKNEYFSSLAQELERIR